MNKSINQLEPKTLWENFEKICQIPHPSKKESKISQFVKAFGEKLKLETMVDHCGNVIIRKPATAGMENCKTVILQAHLDMVPQKTKTSTHNFEKDPICAYVDGDWIKAKDTTLGADDGIGVAAALAILQSKDIQHGPIEALFTIDEETGMTGACAIKSGILKGNILLNLDSENDRELFIGCAGGIDTDVSFDYTEIPVPADFIALEIHVANCQGGHSGLDIHRGRANAIKILVQLLWPAQSTYNLTMNHLEGGTPIHNAIPREAWAIVAIPKQHENNFQKFIEDNAKKLKSLYKKTDSNMTIEIKNVTLPKNIINKENQIHLVNALFACPHGVVRMCPDIPDLVETSSNLAHVKTENKKITVLTSQRSSVEIAKKNIANQVIATFQLAHAEAKSNTGYPGWEPDLNSEILKIAKAVYTKKFGQTPAVKAIHAGLECGLLKSVYPNLDMISLGMNISGAHSPDEKVEIKSVQKFWDFLLEILKNIPKKS